MATLFLIVIYLSFISLGIPDSMLGAAWPVMHQYIHAPMGAAGTLSVIASVGTIISSLASGKLLEKLGTGLVTLISCCLTAGALLGFSFVPSLTWLAVLAIPLGIGAGAVDSGLNHYVAAHYQAHHMSWLHCFWGVGATSGPIIMSYYMGTDSSWRGGYQAVAMIQFGLVIILLMTLPLWNKVARLQQEARAREKFSADPHANEVSSAADESQDTTNSSSKSVTHPLRIRGVSFTLLTFLFYCGAEATVGLWGASFLVGDRGITPETAAGWVSLYFGGITLGRLITGFLTLQIANRKLILIGQLVAVLGGILLVLPLPPILLMSGLILIGLGFAPIFPGLLHETPARFGEKNSARLMGYQLAAAYIGITILPPLFGLVAAYIQIGLFPAVVLAYIVIMLFSSERVSQKLKYAQ
ncbi:MFS transporter [Paenibacillus wulumuqiensis]|uniref:MFS transporter n=1 Tax=Paenibacillus wulumuqiensis TaxID=1567107 RepID=UPI0006192683|nr:MFS transporter [Paenibacillus wulumuqiensis]